MIPTTRLISTIHLTPAKFNLICANTRVSTGLDLRLFQLFHSTEPEDKHVSVPPHRGTTISKLKTRTLRDQHCLARSPVDIVPGCIYLRT